MKKLIVLVGLAAALAACQPTVVVNAPQPCYQKLPAYPTTGSNGVQAIDPVTHYEAVPCQ